MKTADQYLKYVEWSDEDGVYIGRCPDLFLGGVHGDNPVKVYAELYEIVQEEVADLLAAGKPLPPARTRPLAAEVIEPATAF